MTDRRQIFVFGSNLAGRHGAGSALAAARKHGAQYGVGEGLTGDAYAIPTKDRQFRILPLSNIAHAVADFKAFARAHSDWDFNLVAIGCGLAGYAPADIAPLFRDAPSNVRKPVEFT